MQSIKNYEDAKEYMGNKTERPYANNTRIEFSSENLQNGGVFVIKYHGNPVVIIHPEFTMYDSCGWKTLTTKERINWFLPDGFSLWQEKSVWYISDRNNGTRYIFADGMSIDLDGNVTGAGEESEFESTKKLIKQIKKYVDGYVSALFNGEVESPSSGDCWGCLMVDENGNTAMGNSHLYDHMEENYYVPSLLVRAIEYKAVSIIAKGTIAQLWQAQTVTGWQSDVAVRQIKSSLIAYMKHELNIAQ